MTPAEFSLMVRAWKKEEERKQEVFHRFLAWHAANVMNASGNLRRPVTVEKLLGNKKRNTKKLTEEERRQKLAELKARFGKG